MSTVIDPTQRAKYPVVLSDALLGKSAKEIFTNIRYNHKPDLASETAPEQARLKPATPGSTASYELSFQDGASATGGGKYAYAGTRTPGDGQGQYVLYFDPARSAFVLDKVDSTFNMNLTRTPETSDPDILSQRFEQLETSITADTSIIARPSVGGASSATKAPVGTGMGPGREGPKPARPKKEPPKRKAPLKKKPDDKKKRPIELSLPEPPAEPRQASGGTSDGGAADSSKKEKKKKRRDVESESEEESDDDDDTLQVEYPGSEPRRGHNDFSPAFPQKNNFTVRRFSEFAEKLRESGNEDLDDESRSDADDDAGLSGFKLPSPVGKQSGSRAYEQELEEEEEEDDDDEADGEEEDDDDDDEVEMEDVNVHQRPSQEENDLEAELEADLVSHMNAEMDSSNSVDLEADLENEMREEELRRENELMQANSGQEAESESEVSEED